MQPSATPNSGGASGSHSAGSPDTMSFGRPVDPPDVGAFHAGETASGSGPSDRSGSGRYPMGSVRRPPADSCGTPITTEGSASSRIASSSRAGSLAETGWGTAPIFQQAANATNQSTELGRATVIMSPCAA